MYEWQWHLEWQTPYEFHGHAISKVIVEQKTPYQRALLAEFYRFGKALILDGKIQSSVVDEFIYHEALVHPLLLSLNNPENVLILGGGEGATLREVLRHKSVRKATMVDIDPVVIDFAKKYLQEWHQGAFDNPKTKLVIEDGSKFIKETKETYDAVVIDLTDPIKDSPSQLLYTKEFYEDIKKITKGGVVTQATSPSFSLDVFSVVYNTLKQVFRKVSVSIVYVPAFDGLWGFVYASDNSNPIELSKEEVDRRINERIEGKLRFYDGETHNTMFSIPKYIREVLENEKRISTRSNPIAVPA